MGEKEKKTRARVTALPRRLAKVVGVPSGESKGKNPDADGFVKRVRELLGKNSEYGFTREDMRKAAMSFELAPLRVVYELRVRTVQLGAVGTWMLFLRDKGNGTVRVYSPHEGVKDLRMQEGIHTTYSFLFNNDNEAQMGEVKRVRVNSSVVLMKDTVLNQPSEKDYEVPEEPLLRLGAIQKTAADCGPLCLYAAKVAKAK